MKPIYFPYTYVAGPVAEALNTCFGQFIVYRPFSDKIPDQMQSWIRREVLDVRVPVTENETELKTALKNFQTWAALHLAGPGKKITSLKTHLSSLPFFDELSSAKIVEDIREKILANPASPQPDPVLEARIFLSLAQELDRHNYELANELIRYDRKVADLIRDLKKEEDFIAVEFRNDPIQLSDPFADYMISDRLEAWTRIFLKDPDVSGLFVTHGTAIMEHLLDRSKAAARIMRLESIPMGTGQTDWRESWQKRLVLNFMRLVQDEQEVLSDELIEQPDFPDAENTASLTVYRVPDQRPREFFARCAAINWTDTAEPERNNTINNTLIAVIEF
jgi:hypothetical protein